VKRFVITAAAAVGACLLGLTSSPASASSATAPQTTGSTATGAAAQAGAAPRGLLAPWARETVRPGARDVSPYAIQHVRELQYRLKWVGLYPLQPTGTDYGVTVRGVKAFQARRHLPVTGVADAATWKLLLQRTVRRATAVPAVCKNAGWHACYDRTVHQVTLWHDGSIYNTWMVRGGAETMQTRLGTHKVYYRDSDHVSSEYGSPMPYSQFFDGGEALHGSRLMMDPFVGHSHGCVNMYVEDARQLWNLTHDATLWVTVYGAWS
jgi:putative peptidoglycan binding protein/L,D-transpeptidase-like protein